jgi:hypothetical protein
VLRRYVEDKLTACWSPMQIGRRLLVDHPANESMRVSHETIYTSLFVQNKAVLRPEPTGNLRTRRVRRRPYRRVSAISASKHIPAMTSIRESPIEALDRRTPSRAPQPKSHADGHIAPVLHGSQSQLPRPPADRSRSTIRHHSSWRTSATSRGSAAQPMTRRHS